MKYYLDCEFNGYKGKLISLALVSENGYSMYLIIEQTDGTRYDPWIMDNVIVNLFNDNTKHVWNTLVSIDEVPKLLEEYFHVHESTVHVIADWPDDVKYLSELLMTGPGTMIDIPGIIFEVKRVDAWPNIFPEETAKLVQHNAWCDAVALRFKVTDRIDLIELED